MIVQTIVIDPSCNVTLTAYIQEPSKEMEYNKIKPAILICPGGGYEFTSDREAEVVALSYLKEGFQAFVLRYSLNEDAVFPKPLVDANQAMSLIVKNAKEWHLDPKKIAVIGFSAGGHLATMLATKGTIRPKALIAGYPAYYDIPSINYSVPMPVVDDNTPEGFFFHTYEDGFVPVKNVLNITNQYHEHNIPFELHVFRDGGHGLSLGNKEVMEDANHPYLRHYQHWFKLSVEWLELVLK